MMQIGWGHRQDHAIRRDKHRVTRCRGRVKVNASGVWQPDPLRERPSGLFMHHTCIAPSFTAGETGPALKYGASMVWRSDWTQVRLTEGALKSGERTRLTAARTVDSRWPHAVCVSGCYNPTACDTLPVPTPTACDKRGVRQSWVGYPQSTDRSNVETPSVPGPEPHPVSTAPFTAR